MEEKEYFKRLHEALFEIYQEIARICDKHNLTYFVIAGTLLGAVVDKGYIPWDDDMDLAMPREDYDKFIKICRTELSERFFLHHTTTDPDYWLSFAKVRLNNTVFIEKDIENLKNEKAHKGIYIDITPFGYSEKNEGLVNKTKRKLMAWIQGYIFSELTGKNASKIRRVFDIPLRAFSIRSLALFRDRIMRSFNSKNRRYLVNIDGSMVSESAYFKVEDILPTKDFPFQGSFVKGPANPEQYLWQMYGERFERYKKFHTREPAHRPVMVRFEDGSVYTGESD